jgi:2-methylcitrate dehydratase PrpD
MPGIPNSILREDAMDERRGTLEATERLARFVHGLQIDQVPRPVVEQTVRVIRDTLGVMLAGATLPEVKGLADQAAVLAGPGRATLMGRQGGTSPHFAALVNGAGAVSLELDEGNQYAINHPGVHLFPAAFALAEDRKASGAELLTAFLAGYEIAVRVGRATHLRQAVHPFGTHTIIGTAAAASRLLGLDVDETIQALNVAAGTCIASSQTAANAGASVRNLVTGLTNQQGLLAPIWVRCGFSGEPGSLEIVFGRILGDSFNGDGLGDDLGREFYITRNYFKLHACSRWNHAPIEAVAAMMAKQGLRAEEVDKLVVWTYDPATRLSWNSPVNGYGGKHSIPYNVAVRLVLGHNDLDAYTEAAVSNPMVQEMTRRVIIREEPKFTSMLPDVRPARVEVKLKDGTMLTETVERAPGGFDNPYPDEVLLEKFRRLSGMTLEKTAVAELEQRIMSIEDLDDVSRMSPLLARRDAERRQSGRAH